VVDLIVDNNKDWWNDTFRNTDFETAKYWYAGE